MTPDAIAAALGVRAARRGGRIQSLWSGYGELVRMHLDDGRSVVVKHVRPPEAAPGDTGHARKLRSYAVEAAWYRGFAPRLPGDVRVPRLLAEGGGGEQRWMVLEDLDAAGYPERRRGLSEADLTAALRWLAGLHATFLGTEPAGLWPRGTYWHLDTRPDELARMPAGVLRDAAGRLDDVLGGARFQTVVHGDAKAANLCFGPAGVAAVDFQYTGGGPGIVDVAYLLSCMSPGWRAQHTDRALDTYFSALRGWLGPRGAAVEGEWRALYDVAWADFARFLAGWGRLSRRVPEPERVAAGVAQVMAS
jgi:aminoglycoside phosphotransferase (APT) family kinase protein